MLLCFGAGLLEELESLLTKIGSDRELSDCTKDELVSFGERLSTRIFAAYLNKIGKHSQQVCLTQFMAGFIECYMHFC